MREDTKTQVMLLLNNMLSSHEEIVRKATEELRLKCADPESTVHLCKVLNSKHPFNLRQCAANILTMRISVSSNWVTMPPERHAEIQTELFGALKSLANDDNDKLQRSIVRNVGIAMGLEISGATQGEWTEAVFDYVEATCLSSNQDTQQLGSLIYFLLADAAPTVFVHYMGRGQRIFVRSLQLAEEQGVLVNLITDRLFAGFTRALPMGHKYLTDTNELIAILPLIMRITKSFAYLPHPERCNRGFDLLGNILEYAPELLWQQLQPLLEQLLNMASDKELADNMRIKSIVFIRRFMVVKRREIVKLKMLDRLIWVMYGLLSVEPECDLIDGEENYLGDETDATSPLSKGVETLRVLVEQSSTNKIAGRVLRLVRPQLEQQPSPVQRVGVHLMLAVLAESFTKQLETKYLRRFVSICQMGISDADPMVRRSAFFSMSVMVESLMPEITQMADKVMPMFFEFLEHIPDTQRLAINESKTNARMFYALENYVESLKHDSLKPHLVKLMPLLLECAQPIKNSSSLRQMTLSAIASLGETMKTSMDDYFDDIVEIAKPLLVQTVQEDMLLLRTQAIHVFGAMSYVNIKKFTTLANFLLEFVMSMIRDGTDVQFYTYNLLGIISEIIPENFNEHFPVILDSLLTTIDTINVYPLKQPFDRNNTDNDGYNKGYGDQTDSEADPQNANQSSSDNDNDNENDHDNDNDDDDDDEQSESNSTSVSSGEVYDFADEREEAIRCIKSFANNLPELMLQHLDSITRRLLKCCSQVKECVRRAACEALTAFVLLHWRLGHFDEAKKLCSKIFPKITRFINETDDADNATGALICIDNMLKTLKSEALIKPSHSDKIFSVLRNGLRCKLHCQTEDDTSSSEEDEDTLRERRLQEKYSEIAFKEYLLMQELANLLPIFGYSMRPQQFVRYFQNFSSRYIRRLRKHRPGDGVSEHRSFIYTVMVRCLAPLGSHGEDYYEDLCKSVVDCIGSGNQRVRQHAIVSLNELFNYNGFENSIKILIDKTSGSLVKALHKKSKMSVTDKERVCGNICRMILADHKICPLNEMLSVIFDNLPLRDHIGTYNYICQAIILLLDKELPILEEYKTKMVMVLFESVNKEQLLADSICMDAINLIKLICKNKPELCEEALKQFPKVGSLVQ